VRPGRIDSRRAFAGQDGWNNQGAIAALVIVSRSRKVNRISQTDETPVKTRIVALLQLAGPKPVYAGFIAILKLPFKFDRS
jgi:hypothetical protein